MGARVRQVVISVEDYRVTNLMSYEPPVLQKQRRVPLRVLQSKLSQDSKPPLKSEAPVEDKPALATIVLTPQVRSAAEHKTAEADAVAPALKLESKMPAMPNVPTAQVVGLGTFPGTIPPATTAKPLLAVHTGGFGDTNGIPSSGTREMANTGATRSFDLPAGVGHRRGSAGANPSMVMQSGFSSPVVVGVVKVAAMTKASSGANVPVEIIFKPKPDYTEEGRKQKINGEVRLQVSFSAGGRVRVLRVVEGLGHGLDEQAVKAAEQIKFKPALQEGQPVDSTALVHIIFELVS